MQKNKLIDISASNRDFMLRFAQQKFDQTDCRLTQRLKSAQIQLQNIQKVLTHQNNHNSTVIIKIKRQMQDLINLCNQLRNNRTGTLLKKQIQLEEQAQCRDIIKQYQARIYQMDFTVYSKQVDISVDHVGKLNHEKPCIARVNQLNSVKTEIYNVECYMQKIGEYRDQISAFQQQKISISCDSFSQHQPQSLKLQIRTLQSIAEPHKQEKSAIKQSSTQSTQSSNPQVQLKLSRNKKMLVIGSQQQMYNKRSTILADPQMIKIWEMLKSQKQREFRLKNQYDVMMNVFRDVCEINREFAIRYRKLVQNQVKKESSVCQD